MDSRVRKDDGIMCLNGGSGRLTAKQNARSPTPSRRGRRSYQDLEMRIIPVGAVAWPRSRMHGAQPFPAGPSLSPNPFPAGPPVLPIPSDAHHPGRSGRLTAKQNARYPTLRDEAVAPTRDPSRRGRRSYQDLEMGIIPVGAVA